MSNTKANQVGIRVDDEDLIWLKHLMVAMANTSAPEDLHRVSKSEAIRDCIRCCRDGLQSDAVKTARVSYRAEKTQMEADAEKAASKTPPDMI